MLYSVTKIKGLHIFLTVTQHTKAASRMKFDSDMYWELYDISVLLGIVSMIQGVAFKMQPKYNHVLRYKSEIRSSSIPVLTDFTKLPVMLETILP
jgi:hypothetical protein